MQTRAHIGIDPAAVSISCGAPSWTSPRNNACFVAPCRVHQLGYVGSVRGGATVTSRSVIRPNSPVLTVSVGGPDPTDVHESALCAGSTASLSHVFQECTILHGDRVVEGCLWVGAPLATVCSLGWHGVRPQRRSVSPQGQTHGQDSPPHLWGRYRVTDSTGHDREPAPKHDKSTSSGAAAWGRPDHAPALASTTPGPTISLTRLSRPLFALPAPPCTCPPPSVQEPRRAPSSLRQDSYANRSPAPPPHGRPPPPAAARVGRRHDGGAAGVYPARQPWGDRPGDTRDGGGCQAPNCEACPSRLLPTVLSKLHRPQGMLRWQVRRMAHSEREEDREHVRALHDEASLSAAHAHA